MREQVKGILGSFDFHFGLSMDILRSLTNDQLSLTVGKNMGTIGEQFRHMGRVITQYVEGVENRKIDKTQNLPNLEIAKSKEQLIDYLENARKQLDTVFNSISDEELSNLKIDWSYWKDEPMNIVGHLAALTGHQNFHNGQLVVYLRTHEIPFPKSWAAWGL